MTVVSDVELAVREGRRRRLARLAVAVVGVLLVVAVVWAWAWNDRVYLWDDYRAGWDVAQADSACLVEAQARYPRSQWDPPDSDLPAVGVNGREARAFLTGCRDADAGSRFAPWHAMRSD